MRDPVGFDPDTDRVITDMAGLKVSDSIQATMNQPQRVTVSANHLLLPDLTCGPESPVAVISDGPGPDPTIGWVRAFDDFGPEALLFIAHALDSSGTYEGVTGEILGAISEVCRVR